jgi:hypothetical protein
MCKLIQVKGQVYLSWFPPPGSDQVGQLWSGSAYCIVHEEMEVEPRGNKLLGLIAPFSE